MFGQGGVWTAGIYHSLGWAGLELNAIEALGFSMRMEKVRRSLG